MSVTGSGTAAEHQSETRFCPEKSPKPPQVSVLKEVLRGMNQIPCAYQMLCKQRCDVQYTGFGVNR